MIVTLLAGLMLAGCASGDDDQTTTPSRVELRQMFGPDQPLPAAGAGTVKVPNVVGIPSARAADELAALGLHVTAKFPGPIGNPDIKPECGYIYSHQSPSAGTRVKVGSTVTVVPNVCPKFSRPPGRTNQSSTDGAS